LRRFGEVGLAGLPVAQTVEVARIRFQRLQHDRPRRVSARLLE
jgi:hypothetical protein